MSVLCRRLLQTHTYEGTYEVNMLVAGREATGIAAFKPRARPQTQSLDPPSSRARGRRPKA
eukprot:2078733-Pyramimonas_sp.AAC.1